MAGGVMRCEHCREAPVGRYYGRRACQVAPDGTRWRRFCSRHCAALGTGAVDRWQKAMVSQWGAYRDRVLTGLLEQMRGHTRTVDGTVYVEAKAMVRVLLEARRVAYRRGVTAQYMRQRRGQETAA